MRADGLSDKILKIFAVLAADGSGPHARGHCCWVFGSIWANPRVVAQEGMPAAEALPAVAAAVGVAKGFAVKPFGHEVHRARAGPEPS